MKPPPRSFDFQERLDFSHGSAPDVDAVFRIVRSRIPHFKGIRKASTVNDKTGTDYYIERTNLFSLAVDLKLRDTDYADDLALETYNVVETQKPGWTRDGSRATDYILWYWRDTGRFFFVPFPPLCFVFQRLWQEWTGLYQTARQRTPPKNGRRGWHSECVFVPRTVVLAAIERWSSGQVPLQNGRTDGTVPTHQL